MTDASQEATQEIQEQEELVINIKITESAQEYLAQLLSSQAEGTGVRIFVEDAGTPKAECCMAYRAPDEEDDGTETELEYANFSAFIGNDSVPYLLDAVIDYNKDRFGGQLTFKAPNSKVPQVGENASIEEKINYVLQSEINPNLASHGGSVMLLDLIDDAEAGLTAVLKFGGGCQGCSAADMTLRGSVETTLRLQVPEIMNVVDETDHTVTENAYYK